MLPNLETVLRPWAEQLRRRVNLPVLLRWTDATHHAASLRLGDYAEPKVVIDVRQASAWPLLMSPSLDRLGQAYVEGQIDVSGSIADVLSLAHDWSVSHGSENAGARASTRLARAVHSVTHKPATDQAAIGYHYDVSNAFYQLWLDPAMVSSGAYFENGNETLAQAQLKKIDHILTKLQLRPGQRLLDIGCGWGALVLRAASKYEAQCVGVTLSKNQFELATERVRAAGLQDRVEIRLQDYRGLSGQFDRIASVGMFEHVGLRHLSEYFSKISSLLVDDGWVLNHGITSTDAHDGEVGLGGGRFIDRYVFPQGELPHISTVLKTMQTGGLEACDVENLRRHYARTMALWSENFEAHTPALKALVDEKRWRIWRVYLAGCQWTFEHDETALYQVLCRKAGRSAQEQPWSRGWMYAPERAPG